MFDLEFEWTLVASDGKIFTYGTQGFAPRIMITKEQYEVLHKPDKLRVVISEGEAK